VRANPNILRAAASSVGRSHLEVLEGIHGLRAMLKYAHTSSGGGSRDRAMSDATERGTGEIIVNTGKQGQMVVCPKQGTMAGSLIAAKNTDKTATSIVNMFGGKKTKHRW
jgi:hypothetical protein